VPTAAACGLAGLTKGPVGVALPGLVLVLYFLWNRELRRLWDRRLGWAVLAFLLVAGPWYGLVAAETRGAWPKAFFLNENVNRALNPMENHSGPVFYHAAALLVLFAPWSIFLAGVLWCGVKACRRANPERERRGGSEDDPVAHAPGSPDPVAHAPGSPDPRPHRFLVCWFAAYLVFFSLAATKLPNYVLPLYPALAILTAWFLVRWRDGDLVLPRWMMPAAVGGMVLVAVGVGGGLLVGSGAVPVLPAKARVFPGLERWAAIGLVPLLGAVCLGWLLRRGDRGGFVRAAAVTAVAFVGLIAAFPAGEVDRYKAPRELVRATGVDDPRREVRLAGFDWFQPSVVFYARREVKKLDSPDKAAEFLAVPTPGYLFVSEPAWAARVANRVAVPHRVAARHFDMYRNCDVLVVTNEPEGAWVRR
jgi:4-amino-4-deoxy-L-arabinose transferase-like glycosyltransferase